MGAIWLPAIFCNCRSVNLCTDSAFACAAESPFDLVDCIGPSAGGLANQIVSVPLSGDLLQRLTGNVCALSPQIPRFLNPGRSYEVQLRGFRQPDGTPNATYSLVSIRDGRDFTRINFPINANDNLTSITSDGLRFSCKLRSARAKLKTIVS